MKKFVFSMEKILELRRFEQKQAEAELGKANAEVARIQNSLNEIAQKQILSRKMMEGKTDILLLSQNQNFKILLEQQKQQCMEEIVQAQMVADEKKQVVVEAMQKVKVLEKLREKKYSQWKKETEKQEETEIEDIVTSGFNRR